MFFLIVGLALWIGAHVLKRVAPGLRRDMDIALGEKASKGVMGMVILLSVVLMVVGYLRAAVIPVYTPPPGAGWINNILMVASIIALGVGPAGGRLSARFRHPMLFGVILWGVAHLLVNGDIASILLFGTITFWALWEVRLINTQEGPWDAPKPGNAVQDGKLILSAVFLYFLIAGIHWLANHNPFEGTYP